MKTAYALLTAFIAIVLPAGAQMRVMAEPNHSPLVTFRIVFTVGAAADTPSKPGLAYLTAAMIANSGSKSLTYQQIEDAMFPLAADFSSQVDKEMTTFYGTTHVDHLDEYYKLIHGMLLDPGWREDDFKRVKDDCIHSIQSGLRNNDEELAKEVLYSDIYQGMPYAHYNGGTVSGLESITLDDVRGFYGSRYTQGVLILGLSGGFTPAFLEKVKADMRKLPPSIGMHTRHPEPGLIHGNRAIIVEKDTRATAISFGFPISCTRQNPDWPALLVASSYLGQHRMAGGVLYDEMREKRGLNYGDYSYIEYFPQGMYRMAAEQNLARRYQIFQIWIRPVHPENAKFALRLALYELDQLIKNGISEENFQMSRDFVSKYSALQLRTQSAQLGFAVDSLFYDSPAFIDALRAKLSKLTAAEVTRVARRYLRTKDLSIAIVANHAEDLRQQLASDDPSPMEYNTPKSQAILDVDKVVQKWPLDLKADSIQIVPAAQIFQ
ncbi:MAG TPA: pitrilysin family protein [Bryobacteraceae bacterium]|nr:pitrilysin family protein [Bryobacteraceae bacterium]